MNETKWKKPLLRAVVINILKTSHIVPWRPSLIVLLLLPTAEAFMLSICPLPRMRIDIYHTGRSIFLFDDFMR